MENLRNGVQWLIREVVDFSEILTYVDDYWIIIDKSD